MNHLMVLSVVGLLQSGLVFAQVGSSTQLDNGVSANVSNANFGTRVITTNQSVVESKVDVGVSIGVARDRVRVVARGGTGAVFNTDYNVISSSSPNREFPIYLRRLYLEVEPNQDFKLGLGSFGPNYGGVGGSTTYLKSSGYIMGARSEFSLAGFRASTTVGYLGDLNTPSLFDRIGRAGRFNYGHLTLSRRLNRFFDVGFGATYLYNQTYARGSMKVTPFGSGQRIAIEGMAAAANLGAHTFSAGFENIFDSTVIDFGAKFVRATNQPFSHAALSHLSGGDYVEFMLKKPGNVELFAIFRQTVVQSGEQLFIGGLNINI